jgi:UDP-glucose:(heptosyl)LPS alpha-1,3-glucosyltransferase
VHFLGLVRDVARYHATADAFILPSTYESFSLATYEAAASGLPLLVTRVSGVEDVLLEDVNGWFIGRDARGISERLTQLMHDEVLRHAMGAASRAAVARYSWEAMLEGYVRLYDEILSRGHPFRRGLGLGRG